MLNLIKNGLVLDQKKQDSIAREMEIFPFPKRMAVPLCSVRGMAPEIKCAPGQAVRKYELLSLPAQGGPGVPCVSPAEGMITEIRERSHPLLGDIPFAQIEVMGNYHKQMVREQPLSRYSPEEIVNIAFNAGIIDELDGVPLCEKLSEGRAPETVLAAVIDEEPYVSSSIKSLLEYPKRLSEGLRLAARACGAAGMKIHVFSEPGSESFLPQWAGGIEVTSFSAKYPVLPFYLHKQAHTLAFGPQALIALSLAAMRLKPCVRGIVTVAGDAAPRPLNLRLTYGTRISDILRYAGIDGEKNQVLLGGPLRGAVCRDLSLPVTPGVRAVTVLRPRPEPIGVCLGCGACISVCPQRLQPVNIMRAFEAGDSARAAAFGAESCIGCRCCSYICPSGVPVAELTARAKDAAAKRRKKSKGEGEE